MNTPESRYRAAVASLARQTDRAIERGANPAEAWARYTEQEGHAWRRFCEQANPAR